MRFKSRYALFLLSSLFLSCDQSGSTSVEKPTSNPASEVDAKQLSIVDGRAWTLAQFSDFFDEEITIEDAEKAFGPNPQIGSDGDQVGLTYVVESDRIYEKGLGIHTISVFLAKEEFFLGAGIA